MQLHMQRSASSAASRPRPGCPLRFQVVEGRKRFQPVHFQPDTVADPVGGRKVLTGPCVVSIHGLKKAETKFAPSGDGASLQAYMERAADHFSNIKLPMGGQMTKMDNEHLMMVVPKIKIFDLWMQPKAVVKVSVFPNSLEVTSTTKDCVMEGSQHVTQLGLHDRYNLDVRIVLTWKDRSSGPTMMETDGNIMVEVDIPKPFSLLPKTALKSAGNAAMTATLGIIVSAFLDKLAENYSVWAKEQRNIGSQK